MSAARKPVIVRRISGDWLAGYAVSDFCAAPVTLELLELSGKLLRLDWPQIKWVCQLRDLTAGTLDPLYPEHLLRKKFTLRPRTPGLWIRIALADGDEIEGLATNDRSLIAPPGLWMIPPDTRSITQRIFLPHTTIRTLEVVALIGTGRGKTAPALIRQPELFSSIQS